MSLTTSEMTPADIRACTCGNDGYGGNGNDMWGNGAWWIIILLLFGWGRNGFGGFGGGNDAGCGCNPCATQSDLQAGFNNQAVINKLDGITNGICDSTYALTNAINNGFNSAELSRCNQQSALMTQLFNMQMQDQNCCCETQRAIERGFCETNYNLATQACETRNTIQNTTRDIIDNQNANSRAILDFLTQDKIATLTAENQNLKFQASQTAQNAFISANQEAQTAELIRRLGAECPMPAYIVPNPNCCYGNYGLFGFNNSCGCNGNF